MDKNRVRKKGVALKATNLRLKKGQICSANVDTALALCVK